MAENNLARSRNDVPDFFADDDPLAELARIVGYDDLPVAARPPVSAPTAARRDPAFNLEDELLREFERYEAPRLDPSNDVVPADAPRYAVEPPPVMFAPPVEQHFDERLDVEREEPRFESEEADVFGAGPADLDDRYQEPQYETAQDDIADEVALDEEAELPYEAAVASDDVWALESSPSEPIVEQAADEAHQFEPVFTLSDVPVAGPVSSVPTAEQVEAEPVFDEFDLAAELESSIAADPIVELAPSAEPRIQHQLVAEPTPEPVMAASEMPTPEVKTEAKPKGYVPGFRMPLANFNTYRPAAVPAEPVQTTASEPGPSSPDLAWSAEPADKQQGAVQADKPVSVAEQISEAPEAVSNATIAAESAAPAAPASSDPAPAKDQFSALDELIYDVQRYTLPTASKPSVAAAAPIVAFTPSTWSQPASPAPAAEPAKSPAAPAPVAAAPSVEDIDPFSDEAFELSLDDLDLDLSDIVEEENLKPAVVAAPAAKPQPAPELVKIAAAPVAAASVVASTPVAAAPFVAPTPVVPEVQDDAEAIADLPFDPAQIADSEEQVEAIAELDVPALPVEEPEAPPAYRPEYDLDIDAELASLLIEKPEPVSVAKPKPEAVPAPTVPFSSTDRAPQAAARASTHADLDDFERALEEDFRRSLSAPLAPADREELQYPEADYLATVENARRSALRSWGLPLVLAGVVILGGAGAYAWLGKGLPGAASSGEPIIIAADKEPVKVAPENPGGKTVPNQDKAVYDRVAGVSSAAPKQSSLISSNEQPVDVVQKTLMPDTLPLEGENDIAPTDVGETQDPRLLPQQKQAAVPADQQPVTVMPRKVKTMIVRPDGKLVEQEVPAPALAAPTAAKAPVAAQNTEVASRPAATASMPAPASSTPVKPATAQPAVPTTGAAGVVPVSAPVAATAPSTTAAAPKTGQVTPAAVMPASVPAAAPVAPVAQQASVQPVSVPTATTPATSSRAPVPAARPAEQPVNVVAAVSDQGNVRASGQAQPAAASTQVASLGDGGYVIQIASLPSQAEAQKSYQSLSSKFGSVIGGRGVDIKAAEVAGKGTFYRVRIPAGSKDNAVALCEKYRAAGGSCLVAK